MQSADQLLFSTPCTLLKTKGYGEFSVVGPKMWHSLSQLIIPPLIRSLQGCFEVMDRQLLCEPHGEDIDLLTECITDVKDCLKDEVGGWIRI